MYQGFYNLTSGMLSQQRNLNVISNNMANTQTAGYKADTMTKKTFQEEMLVRTGRYNKKNPTDLATTSKITTADQTYTDYSQGAFEMTDDIYDFAINGKGWFSVQTNSGTQYTRSGSFSVDSEGYLTLGGVGRVLGSNDQPIQIPNEDFTVNTDGSIIANQHGAANRKAVEVDADGNVTSSDDGETETVVYGKIKLVDFADTSALHKEDNGMYTTEQEVTVVNGNSDSTLQWRMLEKSNVSLVDEMTNMMASQRALQSAAQMLKMYDSIMAKSSSDVGRL
jgi:flagellar basal-body rod protein FlgG